MPRWPMRLTSYLSGLSESFERADSFPDDSCGGSGGGASGVCASTRGANENASHATTNSNRRKQVLNFRGEVTAGTETNRMGPPTEGCHFTTELSGLEGKRKDICGQDKTRQKRCWVRLLADPAMSRCRHKSNGVSRLEGHHCRVTEVRCDGNQD